jgi:hypothetical protein
MIAGKCCGLRGLDETTDPLRVLLEVHECVSLSSPARFCGTGSAGGDGSPNGEPNGQPYGDLILVPQGGMTWIKYKNGGSFSRRFARTRMGCQA